MYRAEGGAGAGTKLVRAAIYTRVSTDESLGMEFNSLDAQQEACAAYIVSQRHEGWEPITTRYDDGGYSGGSMKRPALERLLEDVRAGRIDVIVVYKIDRLTRSLADFSRIVDVLDAHGASFISITQAFSTTTSMGRLTLNVLLSFAQFEREVGAERVRDKIDSSKKKGMWMGGVVPLGYDVLNRKLVVNKAEARTVRDIFEWYIALRSARLLHDELKNRGVVSKRSVGKNGEERGGTAFTRGALYNLLQNVTYVGRVAHRGEVYEGQHKAIVDLATFEQAQAILVANRAERRQGTSARDPSLLVGLLFDEQGERLTPSHTTKGSRRFRYYVGAIKGSEGGRRYRVPAHELERLVVCTLREWLEDAHCVEAALATDNPDAVAIDALLFSARQCADELNGKAAPRVRELLGALIERVTIGEAQIGVALRPGALAGISGLRLAGAVPPIDLQVPCQLVRRSREVRLAVSPKAPSSSAHIDPSLIKLLVKAHAAREALLAARGASLAEVAEREGHEPHYFAVLVKLSYLAPDIVEMILEGRQPVRLNRQALARLRNLPVSWNEQRDMIRQYEHL